MSRHATVNDSPSEHYVDTRQDLLKALRRKPPHSLAEPRSIDGDQLRSVGH